MAVRACQAGRVAFATAAEWVDRLAEAHHTGRLADELTRLGRYPLIVVDEVGYIPFEAEAADLFFQLVSNRYDRRGRCLRPARSRPAGGGRGPVHGHGHRRRHRRPDRVAGLAARRRRGAATGLHPAAGPGHPRRHRDHRDHHRERDGRRRERGAPDAEHPAETDFQAIMLSRCLW
ncbi:ATP-binding protein [Streptomyces sp. NBC_00048]|uniref:ATP-binding protein n=1 Tax=Streptomyces sp. NBC_00048 TaxID=2975628 RepID=UPI00386B3651